MRPLTHALAAELRERYGEDGAGGEPEPKRLRARMDTLSSRSSRDARSRGGGLARYDERGGRDPAHVRQPEARGRGLGRAILSELEAAARALGYDALRLETGTGQPEALGLYASAGFERIPRYRPYVNDPTSVCFQKRL